MIAGIIVVSIMMISSFFFTFMDDTRGERVWTIAMQIILLAFLLLFTWVITTTKTTESVEKQTSISYLNNHPIYEKQYVIDKDGSVVDSLYVKIKTTK